MGADLTDLRPKRLGHKDPDQRDRGPKAHNRHREPRPLHKIDVLQAGMGPGARMGVPADELLILNAKAPVPFDALPKLFPIDLEVIFRPTVHILKR